MTAALGGQVALVTGGAGTIGAAVAEMFAEQGAGVVVADLDVAACKDLAGRVNREGLPGRAAGTALDVSCPDDWDRAVRFARRRFGYPGILVNNAGVLAPHGLEGVSDADWGRVIDVCQRGPWLGMRAVIPMMRLLGGGVVVNVASVFGLVGSSAAFAYHAAKGAVRAMTKAAAVQYAAANIRVNAVYPGLIESRMSENLPQGFVDDLVQATPMARVGRAEEAADAVLFLASGQSSYVTGADLVVDGGYTAR